MRNFDGHLSADILRGDAFALHHLLRRTHEYNLTAIATCFGSHIDDMVSLKHHILIMFNDDNGIAKVSELLERIYQLNVIPLVKTNTWFIKDIEDFHKLSTYLSGKAYALTLSTR